MHFGSATLSLDECHSTIENVHMNILWYAKSLNYWHFFGDIAETMQVFDSFRIPFSAPHTHYNNNNILNTEAFIFAMSVLHDKYLCENIHVNWILYKKCNIRIWMEKGEIMWRDKENVWPFEKEHVHIEMKKILKNGRDCSWICEVCKKGRIKICLWYIPQMPYSRRI